MKKRVISAIVALVIAIPLVIIGGIPFQIGVAVLGLIGFLELLKLKEIPEVMKGISLLCFITLMMNNWGENMILTNSELITSIIFVTVLPIVFYNNKKYNIEDALYLLGSIFLLGYGFNILASVRLDSLYYFIYLVLITIMTDTFAYVTGRLIGKHKMCPRVSPNKTWEGFVGGITIGTIVPLIFYLAMFETHPNIFILVIITLLLSIIGSIGDLVFSSIKRHYDIKDFGKIMPGHGGVLDRLDSILIVMLAFNLLSRFL